MAKVYTKTGDKGTTGLYTGERVEKCSARVSAYGTIDELDSILGAARAFSVHEDVQETIYRLQKYMWMLMADVASLNKEPTVTEELVVDLEKIIDSYDAKLEPLSEFIVPGDNQSSAFLHISRTVARRAERDLWLLAKEEPVHESNLRFLNRLSDLCFVLARAESEL